MSVRKEVIGDCTRKRSDGSVAIYALYDPDGTPRYVGKTVNYLHVRHKSHIREALAGRQLPVSRWLRKRIAAKDRLHIKLLEYVQHDGDWAARERHWIEQFRPTGCLLNLTDGGEGLAGHVPSPERRHKVAIALRRGANFNCEVCSAPFWRKPKEIKRGHNKFCSRRCANARHKGVGLFNGA